MSIWHYKPGGSPDSSPSPSSSLMEPELVCEAEVGGDVMDMRFADEGRIAVGLSSGGVTILRFRPTHQVYMYL